MRILSGKPFQDDGWTGRRYPLHFDTPGAVQETLVFSVPTPYADWISDRMEAPVIAALFLAMSLGEPLSVEGPLSPRFHYGLRAIQDYFHLWYPKALTRVEVRCPGFEACESNVTATASCFSGGVDSFYTLKQHRAENEPLSEYRIQYGLFVHGFDIPLSQPALYDTLANRYEEALATQSVRLIRCRTNLRELIEPRVPWMTIHGAAIHAAGLFLQNGLARLVIPSTNRASLLNPPIGSNPYTDPLAATESLQFIHHGCEASRIEKTLAIADWPVVQHHLRVCFQAPATHVNCGRCRKCQKVMAPLWLAGKLDSFQTFPPGFTPAAMPPECFAEVDLTRFASERSYADELRDLAKTSDPTALQQLPFPTEPRRFMDRLLRRKPRV